MDITKFFKAIPDVGFPIVIAIALIWFVWYMIKTNNENHEKLLLQIQKSNREREDKLFSEIEECRKINSKAINAVNLCVEKLDGITKDVDDIKTDVTTILAKIG